MRKSTALLLLVLPVVFGFATRSVFGQGGTAKPTPTPKATPTTKPPIASTTTPSFRPQNPKIELVKIPTGSFMMGSTANGTVGPVHQVTINYSFYIGKYEVTQAQWQAVMGNNPSYKNCGNCPVEQVSWNDAQGFISKLNQMNDGYTYRLPTEAEWEYACRAGVTGDDAGNLKEIAWYSENSGRKTHAVGLRRPNDWGLYDMHGNVDEWCEDWGHNHYIGAPTDGRAWTGDDKDPDFRVLRGGSWSSRAFELRLGERGIGVRGARESNFGVRLVAIRR